MVSKKKVNKLIKKIKINKILKGGRMEVEIPERKTEDILHDPNRFFKQEMEEAKKSLFFS